MEIREIKDKKVWEDFLQKCEEKTFLQSWNWGEFNKILGNSAQGGSAPGGKIWRFGIFENDKLISTSFFYKIQARRGTFIFVPHGPNIKISNSQFLISKQIPNSKSQILNTFLDKLKEIAKEEKCDFIRIAPILEKNEANIKLFKELDFREAPIHIHPELTCELDIAKSEEELLAQMRKTTRYLIRQAQKIIDVKISQSQNLDDVKEFDELNKKTVDRHHFVPFPAAYLKNEFSVFSSDSQPIRQVQGLGREHFGLTSVEVLGRTVVPCRTEGQISIFLGKYKEELVSSGIFVFWHGIAFYHHGASSLKYPKIPVSYLLIWEAIKEAKNRGCKKFNFWGIAPENEKNHPWAGLSLFKMGFGGYKKEYVKTQDFPLSKKYYVTYIFEKLRKKKRGL
jgi:lipid II:glycine glycyltransferase (peptidoglycan interpeptide bridge formation enzyme)